MLHLSAAMRLLVLNGPNLNLLGQRQPEIYGRAELSDIEAELSDAHPEVDFRFAQSNHEGDLIDALHAAAQDGLDGAILNAGGYSHTSVALRDAVDAIDMPVVEVHISNTHAREEFRHRSLLAPVCVGSITGLGKMGYLLAAAYLSRRAP